MIKLWVKCKCCKVKNCLLMIKNVPVTKFELVTLFLNNHEAFWPGYEGLKPFFKQLLSGVAVNLKFLTRQQATQWLKIMPYWIWIRVVDVFWIFAALKWTAAKNYKKYCDVWHLWSCSCVDAFELGELPTLQVVLQGSTCIAFWSLIYRESMYRGCVDGA